VTEEQRAWERARRAIERRLADPSDENFAAAHRETERLAEVMERPKAEPKAA
jgi:hypothetical protein